MKTYVVVGLDIVNDVDTSRGMLEFLVNDNDEPVAGSLKPTAYTLDVNLKRNIRNWANYSMDSGKYRNVELKLDNGLIWFVTDSHRMLERDDAFATLYQGSELAINS